MKSLIVDSSSTFTFVALLEDLKLEELIVENNFNKNIVSNVMVGVVKNILPNQYAFIDIGEDKNAFLQFSDKKNSSIYSVNEKGKKVLNLQLGKEIVVQVAKASTDGKGACVTKELSFTGKNMVLLANVDTEKIGISKKVTDAAKRREMKEFAKSLLSPNFGIIFRTGSENISFEELEEEYLILRKQAEETLTKAQYLKGVNVIREESFVGENAIFELFSNDIEKIIVTSEETFLTVSNLIKNNFPKYLNQNREIKIYNDNVPIFSHYNLNTQIEKLLNKKVWLKSGGFLIIEETEACVIIDVNTGKHNSRKGNENVFYKTNQEAAKETCRQLKLRNLSGMIIIDFINMTDKENILKLQEYFKNELMKDKISTTIVGMTQLGLMQLTRKKTRENLSEILQCNCKNCRASGKVFNELFIIHKIINELQSRFSNTNFSEFEIFVTEKIYNVIETEDFFKDLRRKFNTKFTFKINEDFEHEDFEIKNLP